MKKELEKIYKEGNIRYSEKIPPGFKDNHKSDNKKFGDLILWFQIINKAIETKKPIIFITNDAKEDWWLEKNGQKIMPLPQLKKEMIEKAGVDFHIYSLNSFLKMPGIDLTEDDRELILEVEKIQEQDEKNENEDFIHIPLLTF